MDRPVQLERALHLAIKQHGGAVGGQQRYSPETREATKALHTLEVGLRRTLAERAGDSATARELKSEAAVGDPLDPNQPFDVHDVALRQIAALRKPAYQQLLEARDVDHARKLQQLERAVATLKKHLDAGLGRTPKKGEASDEINTALLLIEATLSRTMAFLEEYGAEEVAERLRKRIPRRHARRRGDAPVPVPSGGPSESAALHAAAAPKA
jgi:hypothetical protein